MPYTYLVGWTSYDKWYYGVRYSKGCNPNELWVSYFTSSKYAKEFALINGPPDVIEIRKTFNTKESATLWEHKVLKRLKVNINDRWINKTYNGCFRFKGPKNTIPGSIAGANKTRGKKIEDFMSIEDAEKKRKKSSETGMKNWANAELRARMTKKPEDTSNYSKCATERWTNEKDSEKRKQSMREKAQARAARRYCCIICHKELPGNQLKPHTRWCN